MKLLNQLPKNGYRIHTLFNRVVHGHRNRYERLVLEAENTRPRTILEIGVWRGDRARALITAALKFRKPDEIAYFGFDLFDSMPPELIAKEASHRDVNPSADEIRQRLSDLGVTVNLYAGNTRETLPRTDLPQMDLAFIDGGHSYDTVRSDWENVEKVLHPKSLVIFDDHVNEDAVNREGIGVNRLISEIDRSRYAVEILAPTDWWPRPWGLMKNQLVKVTPLGRRDPAEAGY